MGFLSTLGHKDPVSSSESQCPDFGRMTFSKARALTLDEIKVRIFITTPRIIHAFNLCSILWVK